MHIYNEPSEDVMSGEKDRLPWEADLRKLVWTWLQRSLNGLTSMILSHAKEAGEPPAAIKKSILIYVNAIRDAVDSQQPPAA